MRKVGAVRAFFGNLFVNGLGYLYVGKPRLAIFLLLSPYALVAIIGWSRLALIPAAFYVWFALFIGIILSCSIHAAVIATRNKNILAKEYNRWWVYFLWAGAWFMLTAVNITVRAQIFGFEPFRAPSSSNSPTIEPGDFFIANTWRYKSNSPEIGEFVVYNVGNGTKYIKRLVGLPGDAIELHDGVLYRNGNAVDEPYLHPRDDNRSYGRDKAPVKLGSDEFYVLGDFRDNSQDSRMMGPVQRLQLHGRAEYIWFSFSGGQIHWDRFGKSLLPVQSDVKAK